MTSYSPYSANFGQFWLRLKYIGLGEAPNRDYVGDQLLFNSNWITASDIYSFIALSNRREYELVFKSDAPLRRFLEIHSTKAQDDTWKNWQVDSSISLDIKFITVKFWTGRIADADVELFLRRYCTILQPAIKPVDKYGIWYGIRRYKVKLRKTTLNPDQFIQIPNSISLGPYSGRVFYQGQIPQCFTCHSTEHHAKECNTIKCWRCGKDGHKAIVCDNVEKCSLCGDKHNYFKCPKSWVNRMKNVRQSINNAESEPNNQHVSEAETVIARTDSGKEDNVEQNENKNAEKVDTSEGHGGRSEEKAVPCVEAGEQNDDEGDELQSGDELQLDSSSGSESDSSQSSRSSVSSIDSIDSQALTSAQRDTADNQKVSASRVASQLTVTQTLSATSSQEQTTQVGSHKRGLVSPDVTIDGTKKKKK